MTDTVNRLTRRPPTNEENLDALVRLERDKLVREIAAALGPRYSPNRVALEGMKLYSPKISTAIGEVERLIADMANVIENGRTIVFFGTVGTGKDRMLAALLYAAANAGHACQWTNGLEIYGAFRDGMDSGKSESGLLTSLTRPAVLGISDPTPPSGIVSDWQIATLYRLIDKRYRANRCTWLTMNAKTEADAEAQLSDRVFDRLIDGAVLIPCFWPSYRERNRA